MQILASLLDFLRSNAETSSAGTSFWLGVRGVLVVLGAIVLMTLVLFLWARYLRRPSRKRSEHYTYPEPTPARPTPEAASDEDEDSAQQVRHRQRYRKRKHEHRGRNPTLAEIGGLPPVRDVEPTNKT